MEHPTEILVFKGNKKTPQNLQSSYNVDIKSWRNDMTDRHMKIKHPLKWVRSLASFSKVISSYTHCLDLRVSQMNQAKKILGGLQW